MTINIHGKQYVEVKDRVAQFHKDHEAGSIVTDLIANEGGICVFRATVTPDVSVPARMFTGWAYEDQSKSQINKTSYIENCETSAIGRALAALGYGVDAAYASANEVSNAIHQQNNEPAVEPDDANPF